MKNTSCPYCNCSGSYILSTNEDGKAIKGKHFCFECFKFVKLVPSGTAFKKPEAKASALCSNKEFRK